jgi:hypothetical protein
MRIVTPLGVLTFHAVIGMMPLGVTGPSPAAAQSRTAAIRVHASVRGITDANVIGAHALAAPTAPAPDRWRITSGRRSSVGIQVEGMDGAGADARAPFVTVCGDGGDPAGACQPARAPVIEAHANGAWPALVVLVGRDPGAGGPAARAMRLTVASVDF